ncbi:hypothetical protein AB6A40_011394 [Gnathostoma spinigerum]|uniref:Polyprenal reductase n=1 Tax=Gnathostoma spinigerum TaxID=75299 RepID=A0ABD6EYZ8_9BILA
MVLQYEQYQCCRVLANIRTGSKGEVLNDRHAIPNGRLFNVLSCPHFSIEILIYLLITVYYYFSWPTLLCFLFVLTNQSYTAMMNHRWYLIKFKDQYPKKRKALIPFLF